ncbi:MAG: pre-peptidase C-terminal domain-containing protein, partial [Synechococcus sp.]
VLVPISNSDDYGITPDSSGSLAIGSSLEGNLESLGDLDWFKVELEADKYYNFELTGTTLEDSFLALKEANGNIIATDDDGRDGFNSRIIISPESSGTFYLEASAYNNEQTGTYLITANEADALPTGYSPENGFSHVDAKRSFEKLLGISLDDAADLGGDLWGLDNIGALEV